VSFPESVTKGTIVFYSIRGEKVFERQINDAKDIFSLLSLTKGLYIYKIQADSYFKTGKIIKQ